MLRLKNCVLGLTAAVFLISPAASHAAKQVSQDFSSDLTYFAQKGGGAVVFSNGHFYHSDTPEVAVDWKEISVNNTYQEFLADAGTATRFKGYEYLISGDVLTTDHSIDLQPRRIVRLSRTSPDSIDNVLTLSDPTTEAAVNQFRSLTRFKGALYASDSEARVWRSSNGTDWTQLPVSGLPSNADLQNFIATSQRIYGVSNNIIYSSTNGAVWQKQAGSYLKHNYGGLVNIVQTKDRVYAYTFDSTDYSSRVWKIRSTQTTQQLFSGSMENNLNGFSLMSDGKSIFLQRYNESADSFTIKKLVRGFFVKKTTGAGRVSSMIHVHGLTLLVVNNNGSTYFLRDKTIK